MAQQGSGIYSTVMSYVPGTEDYKKATEHSHEEHHKYNTTGDTTGSAGGGAAGTTDTTGYAGKTGTDLDNGTGSGTGTDTGYNTGTGYNNGTDYDTGTGSGSAYTPKTGTDSGYTGKGSGAGDYANAQGADYGSGIHGSEDYGSGQDYGSRRQLDGDDTGGYGTAGAGYGGSKAGSGSAGADVGTGGYGSGTRDYGTTGTGKTYGDTPTDYSSGTPITDDDYKGLGQKSTGSSEDDTGTHHSGYNPKASTQDDIPTGQGQSEGVRGAPIEGENVKGYAIGSQVGSGDTENPTRPGDPSGQVAGSHLEYGPKSTDTRDVAGHGTVGQSQGTGDSSFANVKTDDGQGNTRHVVTRQSTSHMTSSSVTQL